MAKNYSPRPTPRTPTLPAWLPPILLAPFIGSFAGVLIRRLPTGQPVAIARSRCDACGHILGPLDLVPLLSYAALRARCRWCHVRIPFREPAAELACLAIAIVAVLLETDHQLIWLDCVLGWTLLTLAWIDAQHMLLPDILTLPLVLAGLTATWLSDRGSITDHAAAAIVGYLMFRATEIAYRRVRGRDGLGQGDAKLMAAAGAWLGLAALPTVIFTAAVFGLLLATAMRAAGRRLHAASALPFGPPLCAAIAAAWVGLDPLMALAGVAGVSNPA